MMKKNKIISGLIILILIGLVFTAGCVNNQEEKMMIEHRCRKSCELLDAEYLKTVINDYYITDDNKCWCEINNMPIEIW